MTRGISLTLLSIAVGLGPASPLLGAIDVVTTTEDLAALTREVGGDKVKVEALAKGYQDPHFVEPKPSFILKLHRADLLVVVGRELEVAWLPALVERSRNAKIRPGAERYLDASLTARILDVPRGPISRAMGDVHPLGNPHYWLDPGNGLRIASAIRSSLSAISPADASYFAERLDGFKARLAEAEARWDRQMAPFKGRQIVTYHRSWPNLCERFGLDVVGYVEPRAGIPPSPGHLVTLTQEMNRLGVKVLIVEPYFDSKTPNKVGRETGAEVLVLSPSVGGEKGVKTYIDLFDHNVAKLVAAFEQADGR